MKKILLVLAMVFILCVPAFATGLLDPNTNINTNTNTNVNTNANTNVNANTNLNTNLNTQGQMQGQGQLQGQVQGQKQGQKQNMNNKQTIAPVQEVNTPPTLLAPPSQSVPFLYFGSGRIKDVTGSIPNFAIYGIKKYNGEAILDVLSVNANVKFKNYFRAILDDARSLAGSKGFKSSEIRIMVFCAEAQKTWTTGGNLGAAGSGLGAAGQGGGSAAGSIIPQWGGTKADDLFTIIYVKVSL